jgi:hypothetical protein
MTVVCTSNWQLESRKQAIAGMPRAQQSDVVAIASLSLGDDLLQRELTRGAAMGLKCERRKEWTRGAEMPGKSRLAICTADRPGQAARAPNRPDHRPAQALFI